MSIDLTVCPNNMIHLWQPRWSLCRFGWVGVGKLQNVHWTCTLGSRPLWLDYRYVLTDCVNIYSINRDAFEKYLSYSDHFTWCREDGRLVFRVRVSRCSTLLTSLTLFDCRCGKTSLTWLTHIYEYRVVDVEKKQGWNIIVICPVKSTYRKIEFVINKLYNAR